MATVNHIRSALLTKDRKNFRKNSNKEENSDIESNEEEFSKFQTLQSQKSSKLFYRYINFDEKLLKIRVTVLVRPIMSSKYE